jgi:hypothetical protein
MPTSRTAFKNLKELILLDPKILLSAKIPWRREQHPHSSSLVFAHAQFDDDKSASGGDKFGLTEMDRRRCR